MQRPSSKSRGLNMRFTNEPLKLCVVRSLLQPLLIVKTGFTVRSATEELSETYFEMQMWKKDKSWIIKVCKKLHRNFVR